MFVLPVFDGFLDLGLGILIAYGSAHGRLPRAEFGFEGVPFDFDGLECLDGVAERFLNFGVVEREGNP